MSRRQSPPTRQPAGREQKAAFSPVQRLLAEAIREHQAGHLEEAKQLYIQVLAIDVKHAKSLYGLGLIAHQTGSYETAARMMQRAIAIDPGEASYYSSLGAVLQAQRKFDEAAAAYRHVLALRPNDEEAHFLLGNVLLDQGIAEIAMVIRILRLAGELCRHVAPKPISLRLTGEACRECNSI